MDQQTFDAICSLIKRDIEQVVSRKPYISTDELTEQLRQRIHDFSVQYHTELTADDEKKAIDFVLSQVPTSQTVNDDDAWLVDKENSPEHWLLDHLSLYEARWDFWRTYRQQLSDKGFPPQALQGIDRASSAILELAGNPQQDGSWQRKGMVIGEVQAGKTANYIAVMSKAADVGYRVFIVLAGITDSLRQQTQARISKDFRSPRRQIICLTEKRDFSKAIAQNVVRTQEQGQNVPLVLVIKKNKIIINNLCKWIADSNEHHFPFHEMPLMLIDDEADNASVNTNKDTSEATAINAGIRKLLKLFPKSTYIGYTATPFANIFIKTDEDQNKDLDLFPRNFIYYIAPPANYIGASKVFLSPEDKNLLVIKDCGEDANKTSPEQEDEDCLLYIKHRKSFVVKGLPDSLKEAIALFVLVCTIRKLKHSKPLHNSMLINVSRFNDVQKQVLRLVEQELEDLKNCVDLYAALPDGQVPAMITWLKELYQTNFQADAALAWEDIKENLYACCAKIQVQLVNQLSGKNKKRKLLDYAGHEKEGLSVIAIGGLALSRGLTLEGLSISYVLRNTLMYDALLQMARWFGYRDSYGQYCRIYLTSKAKSWYKFVANAVMELYGEFRTMQEQGLTPLEYGLKVRKHPDDLLITALPKMRNSEQIVVKSNLWGRDIESYDVYVSGEKKEHNLGAIRTLVGTLLQQYGGPAQDIDSAKAYLWRDVALKTVSHFLADFSATPYALTSQTVPLRKFLETLESKHGYQYADVALISKQDRRERSHVTLAEGIEVYCSQRTYSSVNDQTVKILQRRILSGINAQAILNDYHNDLTIDFSPEQHLQLKEKIKAGETETGLRVANIIKTVRTKPLLLLYLLDLKPKDDATAATIYKTVPAYVICFPQGLGRDNKEDDVSYIVNKICYEQYLEAEEQGERDD